MYLDDRGQLVVSASDLVGHLACEYLTELSRAVLFGTHAPSPETDPELEVLQRRGLEYERRYLGSLIQAGLEVVEIEDGPLESRVEQTSALLQAGVEIVYQAAFLDPGGGDRPSWRGHADFVRRVEASSNLGLFSYEPDDTKLARHVKASAVLQLCEYAELIARLQGNPPEHIHVVLGGDQRVTLRTADFAAYLRAAKARYEEALLRSDSAYPWPVEHCNVCVWRTYCDDLRMADDHLTVVAGLTSEQARRLQGFGIRTMSELAGSSAAVDGIASFTLQKLRDQARLQVAAREVPELPPPYELLPCSEPGFGFGRLPPPSKGDLFFDIESDPLIEDGGLEYLFGVGWIEDEGFRYRALWAHNRNEEKQSFEELVDLFVDRRRADPDLHIYHYASYEPTAIGRLMGRHATREEEVDQLFRDNVFVDLFQVVRQGLRVGVPSYSLKQIEALYMPPRTEAITDGGSSIVEYERWIESQDGQILVDLADYNYIDCDSTRLLRDWLEGRLSEYESQFGHRPQRPDFRPTEISETLAADVSLVAVLKSALFERAHALSQRDQNAQGTWLLAELLDWHRREDKPGWWRYFDRVLRAQDEDLFADTEAVAGLRYEGPSGTVRNSILHRYRFDPHQEHKLAAGGTWLDPESERAGLLGEQKPPAPGAIHDVDPLVGTVDLLRGKNSAAPHPRCLIPSGPLPNPNQRDALRRVAAWVIDHGIDGDGGYRAVRDLLLRRPPRLQSQPGGSELRQFGEPASAATVRLAADLDGGVLAVQGPPGSGKTTTAADAIVELVRKGRKVGITANSHAVIANLLAAVLRRAESQEVQLQAAQKADNQQAIDHPWVTQYENDGMLAALDTHDVLAGTAWLFTRPGFEDRLDCLVIDEAGQFSLADTVAAGTSARNLVLVGDPMQLAQPSMGTHPPGVEASALAHLLGDAETMPVNLGIFLDTTHRLHPSICSYVSEQFYESRLHSDAGCELQEVSGSDWLAGSGLRWRPVEHTGNRTSSDEEAVIVKECVDELLGRPWINRVDEQSPLTIDDILIVAPYNAQVSLLSSILPTGARVGTVDKFQGQQAPVVITSLATSSADDVVRGLEFLYSRHRLNVAFSRAQALTVLVASPALLAAKCRTVDQLRLVNGLCRYAELASTV